MLTLSAMGAQALAQYPGYIDAENCSKEGFESMVKQIGANLGSEINFYYIVEERHQNGKRHFHAAVRFRKAQRKTVLAAKFKDHCKAFVDCKDFTDYQGAVKYLSEPGPDKPEVDPEPLMSPDHPPVEALSRGVAGRRARQLARHVTGPSGALEDPIDIDVKLEPDQEIKQEIKEEIKEEPASPVHDNSDSDVEVLPRPPKRRREEKSPVSLTYAKAYNVVVSNEIKTAIQFQDFAREQHERGDSTYLNFAFKEKRGLGVFIDMCWETWNSKEVMRREQLSRLDILREQLDLPCTCDSQWAQAANYILNRNQVCVRSFCRAILHCLDVGAQKKSNLFISGPGNCGKTFLLLPLREIYKTFDIPSGGGTYRMSSIINTEITLWQDVRYQDVKGFVSWSTLLNWLEGGAFSVALPQNTYQGDYKWTKKTPVFFTGPHMIYSGNRVDDQMMLSRFQHVELALPIPDDIRREVPVCKSCFAQWLFTNAQEPELQRAIEVA